MVNQFQGTGKVLNKYKSKKASTIDQNVQSINGLKKQQSVALSSERGVFSK